MPTGLPRGDAESQRVEGSEWGLGGEAGDGETNVDVVSILMVFQVSA